MTLHYDIPTVSQALPYILSDLLEYGDEVGSRNGRALELLNPQIVITEPWQREVLSANRGANVFAQIAETCWVLAGRNDVEWLSAYLPRAGDYSDDGDTWRSGYGPRIRRYCVEDALMIEDPFEIDQLAYVIDTLTHDSLSRQAVISIWDPRIDTLDGKDRACNTQLQFLNRLGKLHLTVTVRSNDIMWGWSGINAFEWSVLQEIVASLLGIGVGPLVFNIGSLHLYEQHWAKARKIRYERPVYHKPIRFNPDRLITDLEQVDRLLERFFLWEGMCRTGEATRELLDDWEEPMFKSWAAAIAYYWQRGEEWFDALRNTPLGMAVASTPASLLPEPVQPSPAVGAGPSTPQALSDPVPAFYDFVRDLHAVKHESYGGSWKKRGEKLSILPNIARKVDRLGVSDQYDSAADGWIDLWVYLAKYLCWLKDARGNQGPDEVDPVLRESLTSSYSEPVVKNEWVVLRLDAYMDQVVNNELALGNKIAFVEDMLPRVAGAAYRAWYSENEYRGMDAD